MLTGLDHLVIACPNIDEGEALYGRLLDREPDWRTHDPAGVATVLFQLANTAVELMAPSGPGPLGRRLRDTLESSGPGLKSLVFSCTDIEATAQRFARRALSPGDIQPGESIDGARGEVRSWRRFRIDDAVTHGVRMFVLERSPADPLAHRPAGPAAVDALDHVVINTQAVERATALYGGRLGLPLALDRTNPAWDARLLFFTIGGLTVEVAHRLSQGPGEAPDRLWGLSWRVADIEAAHARLSAAGVGVSEMRPGRRPGSRVFTVREGTLGTPTLMLSAEAKA